MATKGTHTKLPWESEDLLEASKQLAWAPQKGTGEIKDPGTIIIGEQHGDPQTTEQIAQIVEDAARNGFQILTIEEPSDSKWTPVLEFIFGTKEKDQEKIISAARAQGHKEETSARLTAVGLGRKWGMEIAFIDWPTKKKEQARKTIQAKLKKTPEHQRKTLGLKLALQNCEARSKTMAASISRLQKGRRLLHIGGRLHITQIAEELEKQRGARPKEIEITPQEDCKIMQNLLMNFRGERIKPLTHEDKDKRMESYEQNQQGVF